MPFGDAGGVALSGFDCVGFPSPRSPEAVLERNAVADWIGCAVAVAATV